MEQNRGIHPLRPLQAAPGPGPSLDPSVVSQHSSPLSCEQPLLVKTQTSHSPAPELCRAPDSTVSHTQAPSLTYRLPSQPPPPSVPPPRPYRAPPAHWLPGRPSSLSLSPRWIMGQRGHSCEELPASSRILTLRSSVMPFLYHLPPPTQNRSWMRTGPLLSPRSRFIPDAQHSPAHKADSTAC